MTKAVVFDVDGHAQGVGSVPAKNRALRSRFVEKDPLEQWRGCASAVQTAIAKAGIDPRAIVGVGVTGHGDGVYLVDERGRPVRPAIPSLDTRAHRVVERWRDEGVSERSLALLGEVPFPQHPPAILAWLRENEPQSLKAARWVLFAKDWLKLQLTGSVTTDPTDASSAFTHVESQTYSDEILRLFGLEDLKDKLPPIIPSTEIVGQVLPDAAEATGLVAGTPVASGLHDVDAAALGSGVAEEGQLMIVAGTYSVNEVLTDTPALDARWLCRNWITPGRWMCMATSPTSATNLEWFVRQLCPSECAEADRQGVSPFAFVDREVARVLDDDSTLTYHPFLYGSPHGDGASAAFLGIRGWHSRAHMLRALLEGIVFNHRTHIAALASSLPVASARLAGGGARSTTWSRLFADVLGLPVSITDAPEAGALGAAICAGVAAGIYPDVGEALRKTVRITRRYVPDDRRRAKLEEGYERYLRTVGAVTPAWPDLA